MAITLARNAWDYNNFYNENGFLLVVCIELLTMFRKVAPKPKRESNVDELHRQRYRPQSGISSSTLPVESGECYGITQLVMLYI